MNNVENSILFFGFFLKQFLGSRCFIHSCVFAECALAGAPITRGELSLEDRGIIGRQ